MSSMRAFASRFTSARDFWTGTSAGVPRFAAAIALVSMSAFIASTALATLALRSFSSSWGVICLHPFFYRFENFAYCESHCSIASSRLPAAGPLWPSGRAGGASPCSPSGSEGRRELSSATSWARRPRPPPLAGPRPRGAPGPACGGSTSASPPRRGAGGRGCAPSRFLQARRDCRTCSSRGGRSASSACHLLLRLRRLRRPLRRPSPSSCLRTPTRRSGSPSRVARWGGRSCP